MYRCSTIISYDVVVVASIDDESSLLPPNEELTFIKYIS